MIWDSINNDVRAYLQRALAPHVAPEASRWSLNTSVRVRASSCSFCSGYPWWYWVQVVVRLATRTASFTLRSPDSPSSPGSQSKFNPLCSLMLALIFVLSLSLQIHRIYTYTHTHSLLHTHRWQESKGVVVSSICSQVLVCVCEFNDNNNNNKFLCVYVCVCEWDLPKSSEASSFTSSSSSSCSVNSAWRSSCSRSLNTPVNEPLRIFFYPHIKRVLAKGQQKICKKNIYINK